MIGGLVLAVGACTTATGVPTAQLAGTSWRVVAVNGQPTPPVGDFSMRFQRGGQLGARFGCNHMGGQYRVRGGVLTVNDVAQTLMGCPEPSGTFEQQAGLIFSQPMRITASADGGVTLTNSAGSIALERAP